MNPFTIGHEKLSTVLKNKAKEYKGVPMVFMSHSQDAKKNPLSYDQKYAIAKKVLGSIVIKSKARTVIEVLKSLDGKYDSIVLVVGSDRVSDFTKLLNTYNGKEYKFASIEVVSAGDRDPDADDVSGMSASKMREYAAKKDLNMFQKGLPAKVRADAANIMNQVRVGMNLSESVYSKDINMIKSFIRKRLL